MSNTEFEHYQMAAGQEKDTSVHSGRRNLMVSGLFPALLAGLIFIFSSADVVKGDNVDAYTQLVNYGFPVGLLPRIVTGYTLEDNGKFAVYLQSKCQIDIPSAFPVVYSTTISGKLTYGHLTSLSGIQVKIYYFWLSITAITVVGDDLKFEVGIISQTYPIHPNFDENPFCVNQAHSMLEDKSQLMVDDQSQLMVDDQSQLMVDDE